MLVPISQLKPGDNDLDFLDRKDGWLRQLIHQVEAKGGNKVGGEVSVSLKLTKLEPEYYLRGHLKFQLQQACSRCAEVFSQPVDHAFELALAHLAPDHKTEALSSEEEELDMNYFAGNEIDLGPILEEQFFLSFPYQPLCKADCLGLCSQCGQNMNLSKCTCNKNGKNGPFSELAKLRVTKH